jgi:hypothetical protein
MGFDCVEVALRIEPERAKHERDAWLDLGDDLLGGLAPLDYYIVARFRCGSKDHRQRNSLRRRSLISPARLPSMSPRQLGSLAAA